MKPGVLTPRLARRSKLPSSNSNARPLKECRPTSLPRTRFDAKKKIVLNAEPGSRPDTVKLEEDEVYGVDISVTTSAEGKTRSEDAKSTIYRKTNNTYLLKLQTSRKVLSEIQKKADSFPFNINSLGRRSSCRFGVQECAKHGLLTPFHVHEDSDRKAITAQIFFTVAVNSKGAIRLTPAPTWANEDKSSRKARSLTKRSRLCSRPAVRQTKKKNKSVLPPLLRPKCSLHSTPTSIVSTIGSLTIAMHDSSPKPHFAAIGRLDSPSWTFCLL